MSEKELLYKVKQEIYYRFEKPTKELNENHVKLDSLASIWSDYLISKGVLDGTK